MMHQIRAETALTLRILLRLPGFWIPTVLFPGMLYAFFGAQSGGGLWAANAMASFCVYAVVGVGFFQFGVSIAQDRESPFAVWQRSLPGNAVAPWAARVVASLLFTAMAVAIVIALALIMTDLALPLRAWVRLAVVCVLSVVTATLMGVALGSWCSARAAVPVANLIYLPLAYLGGLWVPPIAMPAAINAISQWTPTRAMGELAWSAVSGTPWEAAHFGLLAFWTVLAAGVIALAQAGGTGVRKTS